MYSISSKDNRFVKHLCKLRDSSSYRWECGEAIIYGEHLVIEAIRYGRLKSLLVDNDTDVRHLNLTNSDLYRANSLILNKVSNLDSQINMVGVIGFGESIDLEFVYNSDCIILENIQDPGNLGTIMRVARASGFNNIILSEDSVDIYNPKVMRASQGIQFGLNIFYLADLLGFIHKYKGTTIATLPDVEHNIYQYDLNKSPLAWVFGNEGNGISDKLMEQVTIKLSIPMDKSVESLNVAMASGICLFESYRQREYV